MILNAFLQAVGALASVVGGYSAYCAFIALFLAESSDDLGFAVDLGLAISFLPALIASIYIYLALSGSLG